MSKKYHSGINESATTSQQRLLARRAPALAAGCMAALAMAAAAPSHAQAPQGTLTVQLSIPAGDLGAALSAFSRAVNLQVVVDPELIAGKRSAGLSGAYAPEDALAQLLAGSGLTFALKGDTVIVQRTRTLPVSVATSSAASPASTSPAGSNGVMSIRSTRSAPCSSTLSARWRSGRFLVCSSAASTVLGCATATPATAGH